MKERTKKRNNYEYKVGQKILIQTDNPSKLQQRYQGPYQITQVNNNGTVVIRRNNNTIETINIRRIKPFFQNDLQNNENHEREECSNRRL